MKLYQAAIAASAFLLTTAVAAAQAPLNDSCSTATTVSVGQTPFDSTQATDSAIALAGANCGFWTEVYADVWFSFTPSTSGYYNVETVDGGSGTFDTKLAIYDSALCPVTATSAIDCDDDGGTGLLSKVRVLLTAGNTYIVLVGSYDGNTTEVPMNLSVSHAQPAPANDDAANATPITTLGLFPYDNVFATNDGPDLAGFCDFGISDDLIHKDVWFTYTPATSGCFYISTFGLAGINTRIAIYNSASVPVDPATILACSDEEEQTPRRAPFEAGMDVQLVAGATYLIQLGNFLGSPQGVVASFVIDTGPRAALVDGGLQTGAPGCLGVPIFNEFCFGDGGNQMGCTNCPCGNDAPVGSGSGCLNSSGNGAQLIATGNPSVSLPPGDSSDLRFSLTGIPSRSFSILKSGDGVGPTNLANPCFGLNSGTQTVSFDGLRCAVLNTRTHGGRSADLNGEVGVITSPWGGEGGPSVGIANSGSGFVPGQTRYFQAIYRDSPQAVCGRALNTSQAIEVTFNL